MEDLLAIHLRELGAQFERQFHYIPGRKFAADFAIPSASLLIEVQGGIYSGQAHGSVTGIKKDNERLNLATLNGWSLLRFAPDEVSDGTAQRMIARVLESRKE